MARQISLPPFVRFFRKRREEPQVVELSRSVIATIDDAFVMRRGEDENGPRLVVMLGGSSGFYFTNEEANHRLASRFPELNQRQLAAATRRLAAIVRGSLREWDQAERDGPGSPKRRWMDAY